MTLTWNNTNNWADAGRGDKKHNGLTDFGKEVVREMNRLGMLVDVSHVADKTMSDALDVSKALIIASHSSARALSNVPRNIPDDLLKRIGEKGGVVQVNFYSGFVDTTTVSPQDAERSARLKAQQDALAEKYKNDPERLGEEGDKLEAANPCHRCRSENSSIISIHRESCRDRLALALGQTDGAKQPEGVKDVSMLPNITYELLKRATGTGHQENPGENFARVCGRSVSRGMVIN
jgi:membrane dipeptidase